jgi:hypothetical protein
MEIRIHMWILNPTCFAWKTRSSQGYNNNAGYGPQTVLCRAIQEVWTHLSQSIVLNSLPSVM